MPRAFRVVAIVAAFNEQDIIGQVVTDLIHQGVNVYFLDDGSTDDTVSIVEPYVGRGVLAIEQLGTSPSHEFNWQKILQRKEALALELDANWFIHHDADEFRESPWAGVSLAEAIERVDRSGYSAVGFALFDFWPTGEDFASGADVRQTFRYYDLPREWNKLQVKCWKKGPERVDLAGSGGHDVRFPNRRVYPLRFILRHYPIRGAEHGRRKVFLERRPRYAPDERLRDWHVQYDEFGGEISLVRDPSAMALYDPAAARVDAGSEDIHRLDAEREEAMAQLTHVRDELTTALDERARLVDQLAAAEKERDSAARREGDLREYAAAVGSQAARLGRELEAVYRSKTWRWTRLVRAVAGRFLNS